MRKIFYTLLYILPFSILLSCGETHTVKNHVKAFMEKEMGLKDYDVIAWSNVDSAFHVTDSMLTEMRRNAVKEKLVNGNPKYAKPTGKLNIITVKYAVGKDTLMNTFYLDDKLQGVVSVKKDFYMK